MSTLLTIIIIIGIIWYFYNKTTNSTKSFHGSEIIELVPPSQEMNEAIQLAKEIGLTPSENEYIRDNETTGFWLESNYLLNSNEIGIFSAQCARYKEYAKPKLKGTSVGMSVKVAKGIYLRHSLYNGQPSTEYEFRGSMGQFYLTNKKLVFIGQDSGFSKTFNLSNIIAIDKGSLEKYDSYTYQKFKLQPDNSSKESYFEMSTDLFAIFEILFTRLKIGDLQAKQKSNEQSTHSGSSS